MEQQRPGPGPIPSRPSQPASTSSSTPPGQAPPGPGPGSTYEVYQGPRGQGPAAPQSGGGWGKGMTFGCLGCAVLAVLFVVVGGYAFFSFGGKVLSTQVGESVRDNPVVLEHLGRIESIEMDWMETVSNGQEDVFVYEVVGSKGSGVLRVVSITIDDTTEQVVSGTLQLASGEELDLFPEGTPAEAPSGG